MRIAGLILAGGSATRMGGGDKPLLKLGAGTILDTLIGRLRPQVGCLAISARGKAHRYESFGLPVVTDADADAGPLAGVRAGLVWASAQHADALLTVPGDTPFIPLDLGARLGQAPACAADAAGTHHLVAVWPISALAALLAFRGARVAEFGRSIGMRAVKFSETPDPFFNINTLEDYRQAGGRALLQTSA